MEVAGQAGAAGGRAAQADAAVGGHGPSPPPGDGDPLDRFGLYAIVVTWMEADVIEATVPNALAQGCDRVLLVDNDSPDDTVPEAEAAGGSWPARSPPPSSTRC